MLAEEARLCLLLALSQRGTLSVSELSAALGKSKQAVSRHLALLLGAGVVSRRKEGASRVYSLADGRDRGFLRMVRPEEAGPPPRRRGVDGG